MMKTSIQLAAIALAVLGCHQAPKLTRGHWSSTSKTLPPNINKADFSSSTSTVKIGNEIVERKFQKVGAAEVEDSFLQQVSSANSGKIKFLRFSNLELLPRELEEEADRLAVKKYAVLTDLKKSSRIFKNSPQIFEPVLKVEMSGKRAVLFWIIDLIDPSEQFVNRVRVNKSGYIEKITRIENCFSEARSLVFPAGPKFSDLRQEILSDLRGDGTLSSSAITISSADGSRIAQSDGQFIFETDDFRFDQVQSFYFVQKALKYAETKWLMTSPKSINLQLRAGYPEKTNAAYYFNGNIRFGDGDNKTYSHIPRDPSIVTHEVGHFIVDNLSGMRPDGEAGSLNEGFADFLTSTIWDNPQLGHTAYIKGAFKRTVDNTAKYLDRNGGLYHDSLIVSGTFWEVKKSLGTDKAEKIALRTIARLGPNPLLSDLRPATLDAAQSMNLSVAEVSSLANIFDQRGWP